MTATADRPDADVEISDAAPEGIDLTPQLSELLTCTSWRLRRAARLELEPLGLTFGQARALRLLARAGGAAAHRRAGRPPRGRAALGHDRWSTRSRRPAWSSRRAAPDDRRSVLVCLTAGGEALLERLGARPARQRRGAVRPAHRRAA